MSSTTIHKQIRDVFKAFASDNPMSFDKETITNQLEALNLDSDDIRTVTTDRQANDISGNSKRSYMRIYIGNRQGYHYLCSIDVIGSYGNLYAVASLGDSKRVLQTELIDLESLRELVRQIAVTLARDSQRVNLIRQSIQATAKDIAGNNDMKCSFTKFKTMHRITFYDISGKGRRSFISVPLAKWSVISEQLEESMIVMKQLADNGCSAGSNA